MVGVGWRRVVGTFSGWFWGVDARAVFTELVAMASHGLSAVPVGPLVQQIIHETRDTLGVPDVHISFHRHNERSPPNAGNSRRC